MFPESRRSRGRAVAGLAAAVALAASAVPASALDAGAWHIRGGGALGASHVFRLHADTPSERPSSTLGVRVEGNNRRHVYFTFAARLGYDGKIGDPDRGNPVLGWGGIYQDDDLFVSFDEAYLDFVFRRFELKVGQQRVAWGRLDEVQPTDNLNPEDLTEFFFRSELERKIGVPGVRLTGYLGDWTIDGVWNPFYTPVRVPNREDRWAPPLLDVPDRAVTPLGALPVRTRYSDVDEPPHTLASSDAALRVSRTLGSAELSLSVFHGWDKKPSFGVAGTATLLPTGDPTAPVAPSADLTVAPTLHRVTVVGGDLAVPVWVVALRAEAAWIHGRVFPLLIIDQVGGSPELAAVLGDAAERVARTGQGETLALPLPPAELARDAVQFGFGVDYTLTARDSLRLGARDLLTGTFVLFQAIETVMIDHDQPFLDDAVESLLSVTVRQAFRDDRLLAQLKVAYNPNHGDYFVWPQLAYKLTPTLHALFEARVIGGSPVQPIGQYRRHDGILVGLRRFF